jgi:hypothetical protein
VSDTFAEPETKRDFTSPFVPGARLAMSRSLDDGYDEAFVEKVHKNGNFTLRGDTKKPPQQWKPHYWVGHGDDRKIEWSAHATGNDWSYRRRKVIPWTEDTDIKISNAVAMAQRKKRWAAIQDHVHRLRQVDLPDAALDQIESALALVSKE